VGDALRNKNGDAFAEVMAVIQRTGGLEATRESALQHQEAASQALDLLAPSAARDALQTMAVQAVDRLG
jgi:octaprenyl-diphosphate synthase